MFFHDSVIMVSKTCLSDRPGHHSWLWLWLLSQFVSRPKSQTARGWDNNMPRARSRAVPDSRPEQGRDLPPRSGPARRDHSSSVDDSIFVGVHGSSYNSSPSSGGTGRACPETSRSSHLEDAFLEATGPVQSSGEAAISKMPSSRQLRPETIMNGPTHPPPTVRRHDLVMDDDELIHDKMPDPVLVTKCSRA